MSAIFKTQTHVINLENVTHAEVTNRDETVLYPAGPHMIRVPGEEGRAVVELLKTAGFVGADNLLVNPRRFVFAHKMGETSKLILDGAPRPLMIATEFLKYLEPDPAPILEVPVSSAGNKKSKKSAD